MARVFLILLMAAVAIALAMVVYDAGSRMLRAGLDGNRTSLGQTGKHDMAPSGIQKAAYIALIVVLFGVASGWLGGL